ncbi:MAG: enolase [Planctomycetaceae bacterium]|nr:MAG: enolase [Planctomycetaceae bacterium]
MCTEISQVIAREVFDSRGRPTVEVEITCRGGKTGRAIVPSGASTGRREAHELRDGGKRLGGRGVSNAVHHVRQILGPLVIGRDAAQQFELDRMLIAADGTPLKSRLGANAILGVSQAAACSAALNLGIPLVHHLHHLWIQMHEYLEQGLSFSPARHFPHALPRSPLATAPVAPHHKCAPCLPRPLVNMISGGHHAGHQMELQDIMIVPLAACSFRSALECAAELYRALGDTLKRSGLEGTLVGDEGGYGPRTDEVDLAIELTLKACEEVGLQPGRDVALALDVAASHFYHEERYHLHASAPPLTREAWLNVLQRWVNNYPIVSLEDPLAEDDWLGWQLASDTLGKHCQLVGDDLFVTQSERLMEGIRSGIANAILVKCNQVGTLSESLECLALAQRCGYCTIASARSGETEDTFLADFAVATAAGQIKIGSVARSERLAKYNQLLRLEDSGLAIAPLPPSFYYPQETNPSLRCMRSVMPE